MTKPETTICKSIFLAADKSTVWDHLTDAHKLGHWFHPALENLTEGADFTLVSAKDGDRMCWGHVRKMTPHDHIAWDFTVGPLNGTMTQVDWHLEDAPGGTRLSLTHAGLPDHAEGFGLILALDKGWHGFLGQLAALGT